jgi:hypothetical protein
LNNSQISSRDRPDQSLLTMSCPFHPSFLRVVHHVTLCHLSLLFPIRLILLPKGCLYLFSPLGFL